MSEDVRMMILPSAGVEVKQLNNYLNMFAATPRFAPGQSRISFDMLKSLRRV
jgi:hypothetical protein